MGLFDLLFKIVACPTCGQPAVRGLLGKIKCSNSGCRHFDIGVMRKLQDASQLQSLEQPVAPASSHRSDAAADGDVAQLTGDFDPGPYRIEIRYINFRGQRRTLVGDWRTLQRRGKHLSLRVVPTGRRIALDPDRIGNLGEVEAALARCPQPVERKVLKYHQRRGSSSALYEQLRRKYPDWSSVD